MIDAVHSWFMGLGTRYGVNPYIFGAIYVGAIPFFLASVGWLVRNARRGRSIVVPTLCAGFCFVSAYLYLAIAGRNIPTWVWAMLAAMLLYGGWSAIRDTRRRIAAAKTASADESRPVG